MTLIREGLREFGREGGELPSETEWMVCDIVPCWPEMQRF